MLSRVIAKNIGDGFFWDTVYSSRCSRRKRAETAKSDRRVDGTSSVVESTERRRCQATTFNASRRQSAKYVGAVQCTQWYVKNTQPEVNSLRDG